MGCPRPRARPRAAGVPGAAVLAASGAMAAASYRNGSWTALTQLGGQF